MSNWQPSDDEIETKKIIQKKLDTYQKDFEEEFNKGMKAYYDGDWPTAIEHLKYANELMVEAAMDDMDEEIENSPKLVEQYRKEMADQPCLYLIDFMKSKGGVAPDDWDGWHPLMSK